MDTTTAACMAVLTTVGFLMITLSHFTSPGMTKLKNAVEGLTILLKPATVETLHRDNLATVKAITILDCNIVDLIAALGGGDTAEIVILLTAILKTLQDNPPVQAEQNSILLTDTREKLSKKLIAACEWITANDPECKLPVRTVAALAKVSFGTARTAIKMVKEEKQ